MNFKERESYGWNSVNRMSEDTYIDWKGLCRFQMARAPRDEYKSIRTLPSCWICLRCPRNRRRQIRDKCDWPGRSSIFGRSLCTRQDPPVDCKYLRKVGSFLCHWSKIEQIHSQMESNIKVKQSVKLILKLIIEYTYELVPTSLNFRILTY